MAINSLSASSKGFSGLVSGINTQETVEKLLSGTQAKIDKTAQKKTVLQYKQMMYREVAAKLKSLQSNFLSYTSGKNLLSSSFFNNMTAKITPPTGVSAGFSVTASTNASVGTTSVEYIKQLATSYTEETMFNASAKIQGDFDGDVARKLLKDYRGYNPAYPDLHYSQGADATMTITVDGKSVNFKNAPETFGGKTASEIVTIINQEFAAKGVAGEARYINNKLTIIAENPDAFITIRGNQAKDSINPSLAMKMFGETSGLSGQGTFSSAIDTTKYLPSFTVTLDGRQQTINVSLDKLSKYVDILDSTTLTAAEKAAQLPDAAKAIIDDINVSLAKTFGTGVTAEYQSGQVVFNTGKASQKVTVEGGSQVLGMMGLKTGISNKISSNMAIKDLNFANALQGNSFTFNINGVDFNYTGDTSLATILNDINNSKAGVKIFFSDTKDRFTIQMAESGERDGTNKIAMSQSEGNLLTALFGEAGSGAVTGFGVGKELVGSAISDADFDSFKRGGTFTFNVNGTDYKFNVPTKDKDNAYTIEQFTTRLNDAFASTWGFMPDGTQAMEFKYNDVTKQFTIVANNEELHLKTVKQDDSTNKSLLGFTVGDSTRVQDGTTVIEEAGIKFGTDGKIVIQVGVGTPITLDQSDLGTDPTFDDIAAGLQAKLVSAGFADATVKFDKTTSSFKLSGVTSETTITFDNGTDGANLEKLFGTKKYTLMQAAVGGTKDDGNGGTIACDGREKTLDGKNAIVSINGVEIERASNTFDYNGLTFTLHAESKMSGNDPIEDPTIVGVSRDTETIVEGIREYLKEYNELITYLNGLYKADATYKDYAPLTSEQKAEMSDREIELWEEKSKEGLLRNDSNLQKILDSLRKAMYTKPEGSTIAIYDLGIATSFYTEDGTFSEMSEGDLKAAIEKDPEAVRKLFAGEGGIMTLVNDAINNATRSGIANPGYLTSVAGSTTFDTSSTIYKQIKDLDEQMTRLESRYWSEYDRYWKQFNAMEQMVQQMNSQSSWLSNMFAS